MINIVASGSKSNAVIYHKEVMVDIGVAYTHIKPFLKSIKYILLTHKHKDHIRLPTLKRALREYPNIQVICGKHMLSEIDDIEAIVINDNEWLMLDGYQIASVDLEHDVENIGYRIFKELPDFELDRGIHATDMYSLAGIEAVGYDWYATELNHCEVLINKAIQDKYANGEYAYEEYSQLNHHSNQRGFEWLDINNINNGVVIPLHISDNVGNVEYIKEEIKKRGWRLYEF